MTTAILLLTAGLALLLAGANFLVDSAIAIARRAKISDFAIGIAVVGIGTSLPELFVSVSSASRITSDCLVWIAVRASARSLVILIDRSDTSIIPSDSSARVFTLKLRERSVNAWLVSPVMIVSSVMVTDSRLNVERKKLHTRMACSIFSSSVRLTLL